APQPYDGVAQLWYESLEALGALMTKPAAQAAARLLLEDERKFIDHARSPLWWGQERVIF
ncbi:MAG: EthD domain-containing protein, partial [Phenylobacterium sp.]|nr:EthD domain-containing protein [Phenylobacterium sp.]